MMKTNHVLTAVLIGLSLVLLAGCQTSNVRVDDPAIQSKRVAALSDQNHWFIKGRMAVDLGEDGGSGRLDWTHSPTADMLRMQAPVTGQSWQLHADSQGARIEGLEGGTLQADDVESAMQQAFGWSMPVVQIADWVRAMPHDETDRIQVGANGLPAELRSGCWRVNYQRWKEQANGVLMPTKLQAQCDDLRLKLVVAQWHFQTQHD